MNPAFNPSWDCTKYEDLRSPGVKKPSQRTCVGVITLEIYVFSSEVGTDVLEPKFTSNW